MNPTLKVELTLVAHGTCKVEFRWDPGTDLLQRREVITHLLSTIRDTAFGGDAERLALMAILLPSSSTDEDCGDPDCPAHEELRKARPKVEVKPDGGTKGAKP